MEVCKGGLLKQGLLSCNPLQITAAIYLNLHSSNDHHSNYEWLAGPELEFLKNLWGLGTE
jgi:hypothetical protein